MAAFAQPIEEFARLPKLFGPRALREIAADHDEVGLELVDLPPDRFDQALIVRAEMQVGQMDEASHGG